jgi:hypothetical protein
MGALGIGIGTDGAEALKSGQNTLWRGQDRDWVGREACPRRVAGFLAGSFFSGGLNFALKKISAGRRPVRAMRPMPFFEVAFVGQQRDRGEKRGLLESSEKRSSCRTDVLSGSWRSL